MQLARAGYDTSRDAVNPPVFPAMLPEVAGLAGPDIGGGEGHNTRPLAKRGARMTAVDISGTFRGSSAVRVDFLKAAVYDYGAGCALVQNDNSRREKE